MEFHKFNMEFSTKEKIMKKEQDLIVSYSQKGLQRNLTNESRIYGPAVRQVYIIHYILKGKGCFETGGKRYTLQAGDSFIIFPGVTVCYYPDEEDEWEYIWVDFSGEEIPDILNNTAFSIENPVVRACENNITTLFENLHDIYWNTEKPAQQYLCKSALYRLLSEYILVYPNKAQKKLNLMEQIVAYIKANCSNPTLTVEDIEKEFGVGHMSLYRYFENSLNTTPKKYINSLRLENARVLLQFKDQTVKDAAYRAGFTDPLYFSKVFKEKFGVSPSEYHNYYVNFMI